MSIFNGIAKTWPPYSGIKFILETVLSEVEKNSFAKQMETTVN